MLSSLFLMAAMLIGQTQYQGVLANDVDPEGGVLTARLVATTSHGILILGEDGNFQYTPDPNFVGNDTFKYVASDGEKESAETLVTIQVVEDPVDPPDPPVTNLPPTSNADNYTVKKGETLSTFPIIPPIEPPTVDGPVLPVKYNVPNYTLPTGGTTYNVSATDDLQNILDLANNGDTIVLQSNASWTTPNNRPFTIRNKTGDGWLYIISSDVANLQSGVRVTPNNSVNMPKIQNGNYWGNPALIIYQGSSRIRFVGVEIASTYSVGENPQYGVVRVGWNGDNEEPFTLASEDIVFDRCYIHGTTTGNVRDGVVCYNVKKLAIINSDLREFHGVGYEGHALHLYCTPGPVKIDNNYIAAAGINVFIGDNRGGGLIWPEGKWPSYGGTTPFDGIPLIPSNIEITRNFLHKPKTWHQPSPEYAGTNWVIKNLLESKYSDRLLIEGNMFDGAWTGSQHGQAIVLTPRGGAIKDVTIRKNVFRNCESPMVVGTADVTIDNVLVENNIFYNWLKPPDGGYALFASLASNGVGRGNNWTFRHNTSICEPSQSSWFGTFLYFYGDYNIPKQISNLVVENNLIFKGIGGNNITEGYKAVSYYCSTFNIKNNAFINFDYDNFKYQYWEQPNFGPYFYCDSVADAGFTDTNFDQISDFKLLPTSQYIASGSDGSPLGANVDLILSVLKDQ